MGVLQIILKVGHPKISSTKISEQKILMWFLSHNIPKPKVFLWTKIKPEYSDILYNPTHFSGPFVCWIRQVPLYLSIFQLSYYWCIMERKVKQWRSTIPLILMRGPGFLKAYVVVFFVFNKLKWEVIVPLINISGIVDRHCLTFLSIIHQ
jgi:hypothetical protein